MMDIGLKKL